MTPNGTNPTTHARATRRLRTIFVGAGVLLLAAGFVQFRRGFQPSPGFLTCKNPLVVWVGPEDAGAALTTASAQFQIKNPGGTSVRVMSVETSCGCAKPFVRPDVIPPGGQGSVAVDAVPLPSGERTAEITLSTDSPLTPTVELKLRMIGRRRPPFMVDARGDLTYVTDPSPTDIREIVVRTIEPEQWEKHPILKSELPFL